MELVDTHAHLYSRKFDNDRDEVIARARERGIARFYLPNIDSASVDAMLALEEAYPGECFAMMGLHPCSVNENFEAELAVVEEWLQRRSFVAVGEIGIDLYWDKTYFEQQKAAFLRQIEWAKALSAPIVIHSRESIDVIIEMLEAVKDDRLFGIFHCFTGTEAQARRIIDLGFLLGIGGVLTFKNGGLDKALAGIDLSHLVLETDAPYLAPAPHRGKRNESAYVRLVAEKLAAVKGVAPEQVAEVTTANADRVFRYERISTSGG